MLPNFDQLFAIACQHDLEMAFRRVAIALDGDQARVLPVVVRPEIADVETSINQTFEGFARRSLQRYTGNLDLVEELAVRDVAANACGGGGQYGQQYDGK